MDPLIGAHALGIDTVLETNDCAIGQLAGLSIEGWTERSRKREPNPGCFLSAFKYMISTLIMVRGNSCKTGVFQETLRQVLDP